MATPAQARRLARMAKRRERQEMTAWGPLLDEPFDFGTCAPSGQSAEILTAPSSGRLAISHDLGLVAGAVVVTAGLRSWSNPALAPDQVHKGNWVTKGQQIRISRSAAAGAGTLSVYVVRP